MCSHLDDELLFVSNSAPRGLRGRKVRGVHSGRLVSEDCWVRWVLQDLLVLGFQDLKDQKAIWELWGNEVTLEIQVNIFSA